MLHRWLKSRNRPRRSAPASQAEELGAGAHEARWGNATVYFIHTTPTRRPLVLGRAVKRLLHSELARVAAWPSEQGVRVAPSLAAIDRDAVRLKRVHAWMSDPDLPTTFRLLLRHPIFVGRILWIGIRGNEEPTDPDPDAGRRRNETMARIETNLFDRQTLVILERDIENDLFGRDSPFENTHVRLHLRGSYHTVAIDDVESQFVMEPRLLLHQDGVVQLTVGVGLPPGLATSQLVKAGHPGTPLVTRSDIPEPYASPKSVWAGGEWAKEPDAGVRMRALVHDEPASVNEWFDVVVGRVLQLIRARREGPMHVYPVVIAEAGACCANWADEHGNDIAQVAVGTVPPTGEQLLLEPGPNFGVVSGARIYATLGSAFVLHLRPWRANITDLNHTLLYEQLALLYVRARAFERTLSSFRTRTRVLGARYRTALNLEKEARGAHIRAGTARDIAAHVLQALGVPAILETIGRGMTMLGERASTRASERAARTANLIAVVGLVVAAVAAAPAIPAILDFVADQRRADPEATGWVIAQQLLTSPLQLSAVILGGIAVVTFTGFLVFALRVVRILLSWRKSGYMSRITGYQVHVDTTPDDVSETAQRSG